MIEEKTGVPNLAAEIGWLQKERAKHLDNSEVFEMFNTLIGALRSLRYASYTARVNLCRDIPRVRRELDDRGIQV